MTETKKRIRQPHFADDQWYSSSESQLRQDIQGYLSEAPSDPMPGDVLGLVVPHAGLRFSGHVASAAFSRVTGEQFDTVILLGPDHQGAAPGQTSTVQVDAWRTPLGDIPVDWDILQALQTETELNLISTDKEHSLEIELPFLQMTLEQFKLVPLLMGDQSPKICRELGKALVDVLSTTQAGSTLFVASSDLSHFFDDVTARRLDETTIQFVLDLNAEGLAERAIGGRLQGQPLACGAGPIATIIYATQALGATQAHLIKYATSGDVHPQKDRVVGYAAVALTKGH